MIDQRKISEIEQSIAGAREVFPKLWQVLFLGCIEQGFTEAQALELVKAYIFATHKIGF